MEPYSSTDKVTVLTASEAASSPSVTYNSMPREHSLAIDGHDLFFQAVTSRSQQNLSFTTPESASKTWFLYLMDLNKTTNFPFSEKPNKRYTPALFDCPFRPSVTPRDDWITFAWEVWI